MYHIYSSSIFVLSAHFPLVFYLLVVHLKRLNIRVKLTFYLMFIAQLTFCLTFVAREVGGGGGGREIRISIDRDDRMGAKVKTQKHP